MPRFLHVSRRKERSPLIIASIETTFSANKEDSLEQATEKSPLHPLHTLLLEKYPQDSGTSFDDDGEIPFSRLSFEAQLIVLYELADPKIHDALQRLAQACHEYILAFEGGKFINVARAISLSGVGITSVCNALMYVLYRIRGPFAENSIEYIAYSFSFLMMLIYTMRFLTIGAKVSRKWLDEEERESLQKAISSAFAAVNSFTEKKFTIDTLVPELLILKEHIDRTADKTDTEHSEEDE